MSLLWLNVSKKRTKSRSTYILVAVRDYRLRLSLRITTTTPLTEAEAILAELFLIDRSQYLIDGLLHHAVYHGRYSQKPLLAIVLGYLYPSDGIRTVAAVHEALYQSVLVGPQPREQMLA